MSSKDNKADRKGAADKAARLAEALRANLHRRKQQARARAAEGDPKPGPDPAGQKDEAQDEA